MTARRALEDSLNVATVRLGERTGWDRVVATARDLGIDAPLQPVPSLGLGAIEVAPLRLATVYATLASGGWRSRAAPPARGARRLRGQPARRRARWRGRGR